MDRELKPLLWVGRSKADYRRFPGPVQEAMDFALFRAQEGKKHHAAKPLKGFAGAGVLEIVRHHDGDTYRAVYTVKLRGAVYVLHAFQKKAKRGIATPKGDIELIARRLELARAHHAKRKG